MPGIPPPDCAPRAAAGFAECVATAWPWRRAWRAGRRRPRWPRRSPGGPPRSTARRRRARRGAPPVRRRELRTHRRSPASEPAPVRRRRRHRPLRPDAFGRARDRVDRRDGRSRELRGGVARISDPRRPLPMPAATAATSVRARWIPVIAEAAEGGGPVPAIASDLAESRGQAGRQRTWHG